MAKLVRKGYLLAPGPTPVPNEVSLEGARETIHHRTPQFKKIMDEAIEGTKYVFQTENDLFMLASTGTGAMEMATANLVSADEKAVVVSVGKFGERWEKLCRVFGAQTITIRKEYGDFVSPEELDDVLKQNPDATVVFATLSETSTGTVMDIEGFSKVTQRYNMLLAVDCISGLVAQPMKTDEWNIDVVVAGSQKGFMLPPGLAYASFSSKALQKAEEVTTPRFYFDARAYKKDPAPWTPAVNLIYQQRAAVKLLKEEGIENVWARHAVLAEATQRGVAALNLELFSKRPGNILTAVKVPEGVDGGKIVSIMRDEYGVTLAGGQGSMKGKIFRISHLGYVSGFDIVVAFTALEKVLRRLGHSVPYGAGGAAVMEFLEKEGC